MRHDLIDGEHINEMLSIPYTSLNIMENEDKTYNVEGYVYVNDNYIKANVEAHSEEELDKLVYYASTSGESLQHILKLGNIKFKER